MRVVRLTQVLLTHECYASVLRETPNNEKHTFRAFVLSFFSNVVMTNPNNKAKTVASAAKLEIRKRMHTVVCQTMSLALASLAAVAPLTNMREKVYVRVYSFAAAFFAPSSSSSSSSSSKSKSRFPGSVAGMREITHGLSAFLAKHGVHTTDKLVAFAPTFHAFVCSKQGLGLPLGTRVELIAVLCAIAKVAKQFPQLRTPLFQGFTGAGAVYRIARESYASEASQRSALQPSASNFSLEGTHHGYLVKIARVLLQLPPAVGAGGFSSAVRMGAYSPAMALDRNHTHKSAARTHTQSSFSPPSSSSSTSSAALSAESSSASKRRRLVSSQSMSAARQGGIHSPITVGTEQSSCLFQFACIFMPLSFI
jgi:hypothetical protein